MTGYGLVFLTWYGHDTFDRVWTWLLLWQGMGLICLTGHGHDNSLQGMGMIAASLLLFLKEEDTFWMMACIVQVNDWDGSIVQR